MATEIAFVNSNPDIISLGHNADQAVLRLAIGPGTYLVFGRVVVGNGDGDQQIAGARLTSKDGVNPMDAVQVRIPGGTAQTLCLQGTLIVAPGSTDIVDIRCGTFRGSAGQSSLFAIDVARLK